LNGSVFESSVVGPRAKCTLGPTFLQARGKQGTGTAEADSVRFDRGGSRTVAKRRTWGEPRAGAQFIRCRLRGRSGTTFSRNTTSTKWH